MKPLEMPTENPSTSRVCRAELKDRRAYSSASGERLQQTWSIYSRSPPMAVPLGPG